LSAANDGIRPVILIERLEDDNLIPRVHNRQKGSNHRFGGPATNGDFPLGINRQARILREPFRDGAAELARSPGNGVLVDVGANALTAASFTSPGAGKSGKPCAKFTAPQSRASRVISRITDSVNCWALSEMGKRRMWGKKCKVVIIYCTSQTSPILSAIAGK